MEIYLDTANPKEIARGVATGCVRGVTTNPTIIAREREPLAKCIASITSIDPMLTVLIETAEGDASTMVTEARELVKLAPSVVVKLPMTEAGMAAVHMLTAEGIRTAVTLVFSLNQAIVASVAGADFVAPFVGRLDDFNGDGLMLVRSIRQTFSVHGVKTQVMAASLPSPGAVADLFAAGCDIVTMPGAVFEAMLRHPLTKAGLAQFAEDRKKVPGQT